MGESRGYLNFEVEPKRGIVKATARLLSGNRVVYGARGLHVDRLGKQKATIDIRFITEASNDVLAWDSDMEIGDDKERTHLANSARKHLLSPDPKNSPFAIDCNEW